jgi:hypothetical protein
MMQSLCPKLGAHLRAGRATISVRDARPTVRSE